LFTIVKIRDGCADPKREYLFDPNVVEPTVAEVIFVLHLLVRPGQQFADGDLGFVVKIGAGARVSVLPASNAEKVHMIIIHPIASRPTVDIDHK
jgi:hypothetical protein